MKLLILIYILLALKRADCYGSFDKQICKKTDASCSHQLHNPNAYCMVKFINATDCPIYSVSNTYEPFDVPFALKAYKDKDIGTVALNITFLNPKFTSLTFHFQNELHPEYHLCRTFQLDQSNGTLEDESLFWDCLIFYVSVVEGNFYLIEVKDNTGYGGTYSVRVPTTDDQGYDINKYRTFFYIHEDYFHNTGRIIVTLQGSPFPVVSYNVSILSCVSNTTNCVDGIPLVSFSIYENEFVKTKQGSWKTVELGHFDMPGRYSISVQMVSPNCNADCAISYSSIFVITSNRALQTIGILAIIFFCAATACLAVLLKLKKRHTKNVKQACTNPISVLLIYHPHNIEVYKLLNNLKRFMKNECYAMPLMVDDMIGGQNPNQWTEQNMISASKVIFFLPSDVKGESATPIKKQYSYALNYFSGYSFPRKGDRFCYVTFTNSEKPAETLYGLRSFSFENELPAIITWVHNENFIHKILYWKAITKNWPDYDIEDCDSTASNYSNISNFNNILDEPKNTDNLLEAETTLQHINNQTIIKAKFDHAIPDVQTIT